MPRIVPILLLVWVECGLAAFAEQPGDNESTFAKKYVGKVRAELLLDEATGLLTYMLRCISDEPVKIHLDSLEGVEIEFRIKPEVDLTKVAIDLTDIMDPSANVKTLPYGVKEKLVSTSNLGEYLKEQKEKDRSVKLNKDEAVSRSFYLYDTPWLDELAKKLETKKFKAFRIDPSPFIYTVDAEGKPLIDHHVGVWNVQRTADGALKPVFYTGGLILDLAKVKKIQALRPAKKQKEKEEE